MANTGADGSDLGCSTEEEALLVELGIAIYRGKFILDAQPPVTPAEVALVERVFGASVPATLLELWNVAFGGRLDYDLTVQLGDHAYAASFTELFYPESDGYRSLLGWIEAEAEAVYDSLESGEEMPPPRYLPFGGFEYLERMYVDAHPESLGTVVIWAQGLPPAWKGRLNTNTGATVCADVPTLFDLLKLNSDPRIAGPDDYVSGLDTLEAIDEVRSRSASLADRLEEILASTVFDGRGIASANHFDGSPHLAEAGRVAWFTAVDADDVELVDSLLENGYLSDHVIHQQFTALTLALARGASGVANRLVESGRPIGDGVVIFLKNADVSLVDKLVTANVGFDIESVVSSAKAGDVEVALAVATSARRMGDWGNVEEVLLARASQERDTADRIEARTMGSYATPEQHRDMASSLEAVAEALNA